MASWRNFQIISTLLICFSTSRPAIADPDKAPGPTLEIDHSFPASMNKPHRALAIKKSGRTKTSATVMYPFSLQSLNLAIIPIVNFKQESRNIELEDNTQLAIDREQTTILTRLLITKDTTLYDLKFLALISRYSDKTFQRRPMVESILGAERSITGSSLLNQYNIRKLRLRLIYRYRKFPGTATYLTVGYFDAWFRNHIHLSIGYPSHARIAWQRQDSEDEVFFEILGRSVNSAIQLQGQPYWTDGSTVSTNLGYRLHLWNPIFMTMRAGVITEELDYIDSQGERNNSTASKSAPWASLAIESWFEND